MTKERSYIGSKKQIHFRARMDFSFDVARKTLVSLQNDHHGDAAWIRSEKKEMEKRGKVKQFAKRVSPHGIFLS